MKVAVPSDIESVARLRVTPNGACPREMREMGPVPGLAEMGSVPAVSGIR